MDVAVAVGDAYVLSPIEGVDPKSFAGDVYAEFGVWSVDVRAAPELRIGGVKAAVVGVDNVKSDIECLETDVAA